jgi:hypothetical protein
MPGPVPPPSSGGGLPSGPPPPPGGSRPAGPPPPSPLLPGGSRPPGRPRANGPRPPRPARPRPTAPARRELRQEALAAAVFGLLSLLALAVADQVSHPLYLVTFALVVGLAAGVLGVIAGRRARRDNTARPRGSVAAVVMGSVAVVLGLLAAVVLSYSQQFTQYEQCMNGATSHAAEQVCAHNLVHAIQSRDRGNG